MGAKIVLKILKKSRKSSLINMFRFDTAQNELSEVTKLINSLIGDLDDLVMNEA